MTSVIEIPIKVSELPPALRCGFDPGAFVLMSMRRLTPNGFTEEFEDGVLQAEKETSDINFRPAVDVVRELKAIAADES